MKSYKVTLYLHTYTCTHTYTCICRQYKKCIIYSWWLCMMTWLMTLLIFFNTWGVTAAGTGQLVRGIFMCSEAYASQVPVLSVLPSSEGIGEFLRMTDSLTLLFLAGSAGSWSLPSPGCRRREQPSWRSWPEQPGEHEARSGEHEPQEVVLAPVLVLVGLKSELLVLCLTIVPVDLCCSSGWGSYRRWPSRWARPCSTQSSRWPGPWHVPGSFK